MSAGRPSLPNESQPDRDLAHLAPGMRARVDAFLAEANAAPNNRCVVVYEACRSDALQRMYYGRGRPPSREFPAPVTNAPTAAYGWHGYGLAIDVIHATLGWNAGRAWFEAVAAIAATHGLKWGGLWKRADDPHLQFDACKPSPSAWSREQFAAGNIRAVWLRVGAVEADDTTQPYQLEAP